MRHTPVISTRRRASSGPTAGISNSRAENLPISSRTMEVCLLMLLPELQLFTTSEKGDNRQAAHRSGRYNSTTV